ncbi:MAG TPA: response regulator transcription factor [Candidatus Saccharimonadales bacterium]|nr:response regulator transcription factor [Candidatus Saccharimonadales bacterium]
MRTPDSQAAGARRRILLIEDEEDLARSIGVHLEKQGGFEVVSEVTGESGLARARGELFDLILLDLMLPGMDGLEVCRALRSEPATSRIPIVVITARVEESDKVAGLEVGADDYITKPFSPRELLARIRAHLRREARAAPEPPLFKDDLVEVDFEGHVVRVRGKEVPLTRKEFDLFSALVRQSGRVLTRDQLLEQVWGYQYFGGTRTVDVHVFRLRQKLGEEAQARIETLVGIGYRYKGRTAP